MDAAFSVVFLVVMVGVPVLMGLLLGRLALQRWRDRRALAEAVAAGWTRVEPEDPELVAALADLEGRGRALRAVRRDALWVMDHATGSSSQSSSGGRGRLLLMPRPAPGPRCVIAARGPAFVEAALDAVARGLGQAPLEAPGWEWARVHGPPGASGDAFYGREVSARVEALLGPGEVLRLGGDWVALGLPDGPLSELVATAEERAAAVRAALA